MTNFISIDSANVDVTKLTSYLQRSISLMAEQDALKDDFKQLIAEAEAELKLDKKTIRNFVKARYKASTKDIIAEAEKLEALSNAVDG